MATYSQLARITERDLPKFGPGRREDGSVGPMLYFDTVLRGFGLSVSAAGTKAWIVQRRVAGKPVRFAFGKPGEMSVAEARRHAEPLLAQMRLGHNPVAERRLAREAAAREKVKGVTLSDALELLEATLRAKGRSERTGDFYRKNIERYLPDWMDRPLASLTRVEVRMRHQAIVRKVLRGDYRERKRKDRTGAPTADATMRAFRAAYNRALREHPDLPGGLCASIDWHEHEPRKAPIAFDGLPDLWQRIEALGDGPRRDLWIVMLHTGLRSESARTMRWEHVDFERRAITIPSPKGGAKRAFVLPMSDYLCGVLKAAPERNEKMFEGSPFVFPADSKKAGHIVEPHEESLGITPHDCRRLFASVAASMHDLPHYAVKLILNHALPRADVTGGYVALDVEALRPTMDRITARMRELCDPPKKPAADVRDLAAERRKRGKAKAAA